MTNIVVVAIYVKVVLFFSSEGYLWYYGIASNDRSTLALCLVPTLCVGTHRVDSVTTRSAV